MESHIDATMDSFYRYSYILLALMLQFKGLHAPCGSATFTWPLGDGISQCEIGTESCSGNSSNIGYTSGPPNLDYNALEINGTVKAFIEFPVLYTDADYAISFHLFVVEDGVFLHYRSDDYADIYTHESFFKYVKMTMLEGSIKTTIGNGLNETERITNTAIAYSQWYHVIFQRDVSNFKLKYEVYGFAGTSTTYTTEFDTWIGNVPTRFLGTIRFGGSLDGTSFFTGRVTCAQIIPCRNPTAGYEMKCLTANWPDFTTTTTPTATTTTTPTLTTATSTRPSSTTTATTTLRTTTKSILTSYSPPRPITLNCIRYRVAHLNVTFSSGILGAFDVDAPLTCSLKCSAHGACHSYAFKSRNCMLGPSSPETHFDAGSILYELA